MGSNGRTSLYDMKRFAESQGLYCRAVKTDLAALRNLNGAKAILHIPGKNHFVVLDAADDRDVWLIDLSSRKFYYRKNADFFPMEWSEGTALLLSDRPISAQSPELPDAALAGIIGASGWSCTTLIQEEGVGYCDAHFGGCSGSVTIYYERWGCEPSPSGTCDDEPMVGSIDSMCDFVGYCTVTGEWHYYYMLACE
ncbi:MAG: hypothetical protein A2Y76_11790 [Planctomycetes bacterium RBG_13_60_9]|nr:MAG: hypothetical protein A2Y76_11790 [Planctomycetes bacterium RBG_13_60_9]